MPLNLLVLTVFQRVLQIKLCSRSVIWAQQLLHRTNSWDNICNVDSFKNIRQQISHFQWHVSQEDTYCHNMLLTSSHLSGYPRKSRPREYIHGCLTLPVPIIISDFSLFATTESHFPLLTTELALVRKSLRVGINNNYCNSHAGRCWDECTLYSWCQSIIPCVVLNSWSGNGWLLQPLPGTQTMPGGVTTITCDLQLIFYVCVIKACDSSRSVLFRDHQSIYLELWRVFSELK